MTHPNDGAGRESGDDEQDEQPLCPVCGAYSPRSCEMLEDAGCCPWEMMMEDDEP